MATNKLLLVPVFVAALGLAPAAAFAQQMPVNPDGTSMDEAPAAGPEAAFDACGNAPMLGDNGVAEDRNGMNPKDLTGIRPVENMSSITGKVLHVEGDLVLIGVPMEAALGNTPARLTPDKTMAVIRLPSGCTPSLLDGSELTAFGVPSVDGILQAQTVRTGEQ
jgi:hypothetical protein